MVVPRSFVFTRLSLTWGQSFLGAFFEEVGSIFIGISRLPASLALRLEAKKKTQRTHQCVVSWVLRSLVCLSSSL